MNLERPALPEDLVNFATRAGVDRIEPFWINAIPFLLSFSCLKVYRPSKMSQNGMSFAKF